MNVHPALMPGQHVWHNEFGAGKVELSKESTAICRFEHGLEECPIADLAPLSGPREALASGKLSESIEVLTKAQALAVRSVNDTWGVFSRSRITLLPHQLWVCRQVTRSWPFRWLVADDVGLGKTVEAGLILWPLISSSRVRRLLIICPASLVEQWQFRLRTMFDIRMAVYAPELDTNRSDFWHIHSQIIVSLQTVRLDRRGRHSRLFEAAPWDLVIVDEAHHLNADEESGPTLGYKLLQGLLDQGRVRSMVFFTGTPHRGKAFGFLALLKLLRADLFDPKKDLRVQLRALRQVMIRNNKQTVTTIKGERLFFPVSVFPETYAYSAEEQTFYDKLTEFIATGKAYASSLGATDQRMVMLVLIAMQKLASSSVSAIRHALEGRLARMRARRSKLDVERARIEQLRKEISAMDELRRQNLDDDLRQREEALVRDAIDLHLMEDEAPRLVELIASANAVRVETKIAKILDVVQDRFKGRSIVFFTEYKATQSLLMSALIARYGDSCVAFINGDNRAAGVVMADGTMRSLSERRDSAAERFNDGRVPYLVSTEAGGEGIDLQAVCHSLIHVDLPWNPMRMHQRVGRLNRYGQSRPVEVVTVRNPDTVESRIWGKLNDKIAKIMLALGQVMDEPEDLLQLVLGMTSPTLFDELFSEAEEAPDGTFGEWFDRKTASFGGRDAIETVKDLVGNCTKFDFQEASERLPRVDLPDLRPFFEAMLALNRRRPKSSDAGITFRTPEDWMHDPGVQPSYDDLIFSRNPINPSATTRIVGVGHKAFDAALAQALASKASLGIVRRLAEPLVLVVVRDRITGGSGTLRQSVFGVRAGPATEARLLFDWEVLKLLNECEPCVSSQAGMPTTIVATDVFNRAESVVHGQLKDLDLPFRIPVVESAILLCPIG